MVPTTNASVTTRLSSGGRRRIFRRVRMPNIGLKKGKTHARNQNLEQIDKLGRAAWKKESGYHRRSLAETMMFRFKVIFGDTCSRRTFDNQAAEILLACAALNRMTHLGMNAG